MPYEAPERPGRAMRDGIVGQLAWERVGALDYALRGPHRWPMVIVSGPGFSQSAVSASHESFANMSAMTC